MNVLTELKEGLWISWDAIRANKLRSVLTTLGIVIGIVTVTLMATAIQSLDRAFIKNISVIGTDVLYVSRFAWFVDSESEFLKMQKRRRISPAEVEALAARLTMARAVAPQVGGQVPVQYQRRHSDNVMLVATTEAFLQTSTTGVGYGRFFSPIESEGGRPVCLIGTDVATNLFRGAEPLGKRIKVLGSSFEVIGVMEKQGSFLGLISLDNQVIIPLKQFIMSFWGLPDCNIRVKVEDLAQIEEAKDELRSAMRLVRRLGPKDADDFAINQQDQFVKMFHKLGGTIAAVGLFVTGLSLFVGGIGIMNIMFVSVAERTREIGIRKAIGAKRRTILVQFLMEAAGICLLGGVIALVIAWLLTLVMAHFMPAAMSLSVVGLALLVALVTGVVSGFLPAWRAARMNPVDALRNE